MNTNNFYNEVYSWLEAGHDMTAIAKHITEAMNGAQAEFNAKRQEALKTERKKAHVAKIYDLVQAYMKEFAPDLHEDESNREAAIEQTYNGLEEFIALMREAIAEEEAKVAEAPKAKVADPAHSITNFLKEMGLL